MRFQVLSDQGSKREFTLSSGAGTIGRGSDNDIPLDDAKVSRRHASLQAAGQEARITDLGSSNGTLVNDARLTPHVPVLLQRGDVVRVGSTRLRYEGLAAGTGAVSGGDDIALVLPQRSRSRRPAWPLWVAAGALVLVVMAAAVTLGGDKLVGVVAGTNTPTSPPVVVVTPDTPTPPLVVTRPPEPTATPRPTTTPTPRVGMTGGQQGAPVQGLPQPQMPASAGGMFQGMSPEQLPQALAQGVLSGQISPQAAQGMVQEMFPNVPPDQLPAVMAQALQSMPPDQLQALFKLGFPLMKGP